MLEIHYKEENENLASYDSREMRVTRIQKLAYSFQAKKRKTIGIYCCTFVGAGNKQSINLQLWVH